MSAPIDHHQLGSAANLTRKTDTSRTHHTAVDEQGDRIAHRSTAARKRFQIRTPLPLAMLEMVVLQQTLARLVTDRAIDRMSNQKIFLDHRPSRDHFFAVSDKDRAVRRRRLTSRHELGQHIDFARLRIATAGFHQAHPTTRDNRQTRVPAVMRDLNAQPGRRLNSVKAFFLGKLEFLSVNNYGRHGGRGAK